MNTKLSLKDWHIIIQWASLSTYGLTIGLPMGFAILLVWSFLGNKILEVAGSSSVVSIINTVIFASTLGVFLGAFQARVFKFQNMSISGWIIASIMGLSVGAICIVVLYNQSNLFETAEHLSIGAIFGLLLGIAQWLVLRLQFAKSGWWIVASLVGGILSSVIFDPLMLIVDTIESPWGFMFFLFFSGFVIGLIYATTTGIYLWWFLKNHVHAVKEAG
jgi:hypothetical protein